MNVKRFILSFALPLFLAAVILGLGTLIPNQLLEQQKENYLQRLTSVEVDDVRPYGDEYEETRQDLLASIRVLEDAHYVDRESAQANQASVENAMAGFVDFLRLLLTSVNEQGYPAEILERLESYEETLVSYGPEGGDMILMLNLVDVGTGMITTCDLDLSTGAPIQFVMAGEMKDYINPMVLWKGVLSAYQESCGLSFGEATISSRVEGKNGVVNEQSLMEAMAEEIAYSASNSAVIISAVSTDMTFRLELNMETYEGYMWNVAINLRQNNV